MPNRIFIITKSVLKTRINRNLPLNCQTCKIKLIVGDNAVTKNTARNSRRLIRHEICARRVNILD